MDIKNSDLLCGVIVWLVVSHCTTLKSHPHSQLSSNITTNASPINLSTLFRSLFFVEIWVCDGVIQNIGVSVDYDYFCSIGFFIPKQLKHIPSSSTKQSGTKILLFECLLEAHGLNPALPL